MSMKAFHAVVTLVLGFAVGLVWLRTFWNDSHRVPTAVLAAPIAAGLLGKRILHAHRVHGDVSDHGPFVRPADGA